jgi:adenylate cyclase
MARSGQPPWKERGEALNEEHVERRLAAILVADMAGYSRLMGQDEAGTLRRLKQLRRAEFDQRITSHGGRVVKTTGDGMLIEFSSAVEAVGVAVEIQKAIAKSEADIPADQRIAFRMGIHVGDVLSEGGDVFGDGVNVAARLQTIAEAGGIVITRSVRDQIRDKLTIPFEDLGERTLKNITRPMRLFSWRSVEAPAAASTGYFVSKPAIERASLGRTQASIAILAFKVFDIEKDSYFSDGIVEDIITSLCHFSFLFVIARNSSFTYKNRNVDARQIANELGVRYIVDGNVRRDSERVRVTVQLIEGETGVNLWAESFEGRAAGIFELQDDITRRIVTFIEPMVREAEIARARRKPAASLEAYDYYLRALPYRPIQSTDAPREALKLLRKTIELDPQFAPALAFAACCYQKLHDQGYASLKSHEVARAIRFARRAIEADPLDALAFCQAGHVLVSLAHDTVAGIECVDRALQMNPNLGEAWARSAWVRVAANRLEEAIAHAERAIELSPRDPLISVPICARGFANLFLHRYEEAAECARLVMQGSQRTETAYRLLVVALEGLGRHEEMREAANSFRERFPEFRIGHWALRSFFADADQRDVIERGLRRAGLPE